MNRQSPANRPSAPASPVPAPAAAAMAAAYLRYVEGIWEGRPETAAFGARLRACWDPTLADAEGTGPAVESPHGAGGRGIVWRQAAGEVRGCVRDGHGGYRVPLAVVTALQEAGARIPQGGVSRG